MTTYNHWQDIFARRHSGDLARPALRAWKDARLREVVQHVTSKSPFYQHRLAGVDLSEVSVDTIASLPLTSKEDLREAMYDILSGSVRDADYFYSTTGTTGAATPCPRSDLDVCVNNLPIVDALRALIAAHCDTAERPVMAVFSPNELHSVCWTMGLVAREIGMCKVDIFPMSPVVGFKRCFELLRELRVNVVLCSPGLMMSLAEMAEAYGVDIRNDLNIELVLCTGELCSPQMLAAIEHSWGAKPYNFMYGSQEAMCIALARPDLPKGHLEAIEPNFIYELLDMEGKPVAPGVPVGEMCLTMLIPGIKPLLRYRTGDLVRIEAGDLGGAFQMRVLGRLKDMVTINNRLLSAQALEELVLGGNQPIFGYQIALKSENGRDQVMLKIKPKDEADDEELRSVLERRFQAELGLQPVVEFHPLLDLTTSTGGWVSWKAARVVDAREEGSNIELESATALGVAAHHSV